MVGLPLSAMSNTMQNTLPSMGGGLWDSISGSLGSGMDFLGDSFSSPDFYKGLGNVGEFAGGAGSLYSSIKGMDEFERQNEFSRDAYLRQETRDEELAERRRKLQF